MPTIPDQPHDAHPSLAELRRQYPEWEISAPGHLHVWTAELRTGGTSVRFLAAHDTAELAARLETATTVAP